MGVFEVKNFQLFLVDHFGPKIFGSPEIFFWAAKSPKLDSIANCSPDFVFEMSEKNIFLTTLVTTKVAPPPPKACPQAKNPDFIVCGVLLRWLGSFWEHSRVHRARSQLPNEPSASSGRHSHARWRGTRKRARTDTDGRTRGSRGPK